MNIEQIEVGKEYLLSHAYGQDNQIIKVLSKEEKEINIIYTSDDSTKGMRTSMNRIECDRYIHEKILIKN